jgi:hypothetical protein
MADHDLPTEITKGANLAGNEYGWSIPSFPNACTNAVALGFACIGGQFQFRLDVGTCEMYWLSSDSEDRRSGETWLSYCERSCSEVLTGFEKLLLKSDFKVEASRWLPVREAIDQGVDPLSKLVFVAYFIDEAEWIIDQRGRTQRLNPSIQ